MDTYTDIGDYFLIGDLYSAALVSKSASIDWLCLPNFDSPSLFASLLDVNKGGCFSVLSNGYDIRSRYLPETAIVSSVFSHDGKSVFAIHDFMLPRPILDTHSHILVRNIYGKKNTQVTFFFDPRPDYAATDSNISETNRTLACEHAEGRVVLHAPTGSTFMQKDGGYEVIVEIAAGERKSLALEFITEGKDSTFDGNHFEEETEEFWHDWVRQGTYFEFCREKIIRSAITLKLMQFYPTGAIIAAPTTSLPEWIGGPRNWDYRFTWMRDATFTLYSLMVIGHYREAEMFFEFLTKTLDSERDYDAELMYTIHGEPIHGETSLEYLEGYKESKPVRIGNGAGDQFQLDVYGSLIDVVYFATKQNVKLTPHLREIVLALARHIEKRWQKKDSGIWEFRSGPQHFAYSKVMAWVGIDRILRMRALLDLTEGQVNHYTALAKEIHDWIYANSFDSKTHTLKMHPDSGKHQDATNFLMILVQFLDKDDPETRNIMSRTAEELVHDDLFVFRYLMEDGNAGDEGAFILCTFWLISALAMTGETEKAKKMFGEFEKRISSTGLIAEEINTATNEYLGNYPQAFSHMGYIMAAHYIHRYSQKG